jgi:hypothetical protein
MANVPTAAGVHGSVKGALVTTPREVAPAKNSTLVTTVPGVAEAEAVRVNGTPSVAEALVAGAVRVTAVWATPVTVTPEDVTVLPRVSVTRAVSVVLPAVGVHLTEYTPPEGTVTVPMTELPARNCTLATEAPGAEAPAVAVTSIGEPSGTTEPVAGAIRATVAEAEPTVTEDALEVITAPAESVTWAVSEIAPVAAGVHETV